MLSLFFPESSLLALDRPRYSRVNHRCWVHIRLTSVRNPSFALFVLPLLPLDEDTVLGLWCCLWRSSGTCKYTHARCSSHELSGQSLSSEDTCWLNVEQHVKTARPKFSILSETSEIKTGQMCVIDCYETKQRVNRKNVLMCWFTCSLCLMRSAVLYLRLLIF